MNSKSQLLAFPSGEPIQEKDVFPPLTVPVRTFREWAVFVHMTSRSQTEVDATLSVVGLEHGGIGHTGEIRQAFGHNSGFMVINFDDEIFFLEGDAAIGPEFPKLEPMLQLLRELGGYTAIPQSYSILREIEEGNLEAIAKTAETLAGLWVRYTKPIQKGGRS